MGQGQNKIASSLLDIQPTAVLEFYRIYPDTLNRPNVYIPLHNGSALENNIVWQGVQYVPMPIEGEGFEINGNAQFSRPKLRVANKDYLITNLLQNNNDFKNAKIVRIRTFLKYLDDENFEGGNPFGSPDFTAEISNDTYLISQKTAENKLYVELELTSPLDLDNFEINNRLILAKYCYWQYRGHGCNYVGGAIEKEDGFNFSTTEGFGYIIEYTSTNTFDIVRGSYTWQEAKSDAESRGGRLAILNTLAKNNAVPSYSNQALWIGATDEETEGVFKWIDGTLVSAGYANWEAGEPNNYLGSENYASRYSNGKWNDININGYASTPVIPQSPAAGFLNNSTYAWSPTKTYNKTDISYLENSKIYINKNPHDQNSYSGPLRNWYVCISDNTINQNPESNPSFWQKDGCSKKISACKKRFNIGKTVNILSTKRVNTYDFFNLTGVPISSANTVSTDTTWGYSKIYDTYLSSNGLFNGFTLAGWIKKDNPRVFSVQGAGVFQLDGNAAIALKAGGSNTYNLLYSTTVIPPTLNAYNIVSCTQNKTIPFASATNSLDFISLTVERPLSAPHNYLRWSDRFKDTTTNGYWGNNNITVTDGGYTDFLNGNDACLMTVTNAGTFSNVGISNFYESSSPDVGEYGKNTSFIKSIDIDLRADGVKKSSPFAGSYADLNQTVTFSIFVKAVSGGARFFYIRSSNMWKDSANYRKDHNQFIVFDLTAGTFIPFDAVKSIDTGLTYSNYGNYFQPFYSVEDYGNGWKRLVITFLNDDTNIRAFNGVNFGVLPGTVANTPIFNKTMRAVTFATTNSYITMTGGANHGFRNGDKTSFFSISANNGITVKTIYYYVKVINATTFQITTDSALSTVVTITANSTGVINSPDYSLTATYTAGSLEVYIHGAELKAGRYPSWYYKTAGSAYFDPKFNINNKDYLNLEVNGVSQHNWRGTTVNQLLYFDPAHQLVLGGSPTATAATTINADLSNWALWGRSLSDIERAYLYKYITAPSANPNVYNYYPRQYNECDGVYQNITGNNLLAWWTMKQQSALSNILPDQHIGGKNLTAYGNYSFLNLISNQSVYEEIPAIVTDTNLPFGGFPGTDGFAYGQ